jgi:DnaK suppressor protein
MRIKKVNVERSGPEKYRTLLQDKRSELRSKLRSEIETLVAPGSAAPEDLAPVFHDQFVAIHLNGIDSAQLRQVDNALWRLDNGEYGVCVDCGEPISGRRLDAIPWADRCISCQESAGSIQVFVERVERAA